MEILLRQMDLWYHGVLGKALIEAEIAELEKILVKYDGRRLLQVGGPSEICLFNASPIKYRVRVSPEHSPLFHGPSVCAYLDELAFSPETLSVVLMPHVLEFVAKPEAVLKEVYKVLSPEGRLILLGFNPASLWGLMKYWRRHKHLPWRGHFLSMMHVSRCLTEQGFEIVDRRTIFFRPPLVKKDALNRLLFLEIIGRLCWSALGGVYIIIAKKRVSTLTPIKEGAYVEHPELEKAYLKPSA